MRLKRVRLFGFKTFAERAEFDLEGGVVAVVGPNGCGKSNLVEAILWGLGEGNARALRAHVSADVIFNGAKSRRGVGYAEVALLFDNEDGGLPIEASEVEVSRRITRGGESQYAINRRNCRLRDVQELLADSGLGRAGYAVVGQRDIDQAVAASADERRAWLDEAAGVQRYRSRKIESLRRLATARDHLERVGDLVAELDRQEGPLAEEAARAERARRIATELQGIEVGLLARELGRARREAEGAAARAEDSRAAVELARVRAVEAEAAALRLADEEAAADARIEEIAAKGRAARSSLEAAATEARVGEEKISGLDAFERELAPLIEDARRAEADERRRSEEAIRAVEAANEELQRADQKASGAAEAARLARERRSEVESRLTRARAERDRADRIRLEREAQSVRRRIAEEELGRLVARTAELTGALVIREEERRAAEAALETSSDPDAEKRFLACATRVGDARRARDSAAQIVARTETRAAALAASLANAEGAAPALRELLRAARQGEIEIELTPVGSAAEVDPRFVRAVEVALGGAANDLIVSREADARRAIEWLKLRRAGRATFHPLDLVREEAAGPPEAGSLGIASELIHCDPAHRPVFRSLLGRVLVVEELDAAVRLARKPGRWSRFVTLDGEVVSSRGAVTGGEGPRRAGGLVAARAELAAAEAAAAHAEKDLRSAEASLRSAEEEHSIEEAVREEARMVHAESLERARDAERRFEETRREMQAAEAATARLRTEIGVEPEPLPDAPDVSALQEERDKAADVAAAAEAERAAAVEAAARLRTDFARTRSEAQRAALAVSAATAARERLLARASSLAPERRDLTTRVSQARNAVEEAKMIVESLRIQEEATASEVHAARTQRLAATAVERAARAEIAARTEELHDAELIRTRAESRRAVAAERLMDVYGVTESDALAQEDVHEIPPDAAQAVARLRRELKAMGEVSYAAIEAYEMLSQRLSELRVQSEDVRRTLDEVEAGIAELDGLTRERFLTTFAAVAAAFGEEFGTLFGGGEGALRLSDEQNVLESGVEIEATLPGKRRQGLSLLSGGERSLCALAFLFALLRVRPSPLVVLDEVDAPLDGRNVERFADRLVALAESLQFLVITHNPATIERAPVWLGVTMQEPGVSTLIPARLGAAKEAVGAR